MKTETISVSVACVDDDRAEAALVEKHLSTLGCSVTVFTEPARCLAALGREAFDIIITDLRMPGMDGVRLLAEAKKISPSTEVIIVTGDADKQAAIEAVKLGAFDFFEKPILKDQLIESVKRTIRYTTALRERDQMATQLAFVSDREAKRWGIDAFIGKSKAIRKIVEDIKLAQRTNNASVLITGESGTGKELVARAVHFGGPRSAFPFVPVNCCAVSPELAESVLFGHVRGAFTGAIADVKGCFDMAHKGTLFLDEIGDMPAALQTKLLRVLEDGMVVPVGKTAGHEVDVRVVAATNSDLEEKIASGRFRADLYYRLGGFAIHVPPLRERPDDIPMLARHFAESLSVEMGLANPGVTDDVLAVLKEQSFPGNVRQLRNVIEQALIHSGGRGIEPHHLRLPPLRFAPSPGAPVERGRALPLNLQEAEAVLVNRAMAEAGGNVSAAARLLGISRPKLYRKLPGAGKGIPEDAVSRDGATA